MKYLPQLPEITLHEKLPPGAKEIARINEDEDLHIFVRYQGNLIIVTAFEDYKGEGAVDQFDLPLGFLSWFPQALVDFRKPPSEGGLRAGAMMSSPDIVGGEELFISRSMGDRDWPMKGPPPGYNVVNRSRLTRGDEELPVELHAPQDIKFSEDFLFEGGLLNLIRRLGAEYKAGLL